MGRKTKKRWTSEKLRKIGIPAVLIPGILWASVYGTGNLEKIKNYYQSRIVFPKNGVVRAVEDGDTMELVGGARVRMIGIDAPNRGEEGYKEARSYLQDLVENEKVYLEYDRYQDDKYGRILAWVWIGCESDRPKFKGANYMHLSGKESREQLRESPEGCKKGKLVNREMIKKGWAEVVNYSKRGPVKYKLEGGRVR